MSDISDSISALQQTVDKLAPNATEEATKQSLVLPFIARVFGYDVWNPDEVIPEFTADVGIKNGEKVDYAICRNGKPQILIECKKINENLDGDFSQIFRYFNCVEHAHVAVLTNGTEYRFFSDIDAPNRMDSKPFMVFDILKPDKALYKELEKLSKSKFDIVGVMQSAERLKYERAIMTLINNQLMSPDESFVRYVMGEIYSGSRSKTRVEWFTSIVRDAMSKVVSMRVDERLASALKANASMPQDNLVEQSVIEPTPAENMETSKVQLSEIYYKDFADLLRAHLISTDEPIYIRKSEINVKKLDRPQPMGTFESSWEAKLGYDGKLIFNSVKYPSPSTLVRILTNQQSAAGYRYMWVERDNQQIPIEYLRRIKGED